MNIKQALAEENKLKNSQISIALIALNLLLVLIYAATNRLENESSETLALVYLGVAATVLTGAFAYTYHGKGYRWAKWIFAICLIGTILLVGAFWYASQLARAFQH